MNLTIDDVEYEFSQLGASKVYAVAKKALGLLQGAVSLNGGEADINIGAILKNIGSDEFEFIEKFVFSTVSAKVDGKAVMLKNQGEFDLHFQGRFHHIPQLVIKGAIFHFSGFFPNGAELAKNINLQTIQSLMEKQA